MLSLFTKTLMCRTIQRQGPHSDQSANLNGTRKCQRCRRRHDNRAVCNNAYQLSFRHLGQIESTTSIRAYLVIRWCRHAHVPCRLLLACDGVSDTGTGMYEPISGTTAQAMSDFIHALQGRRAAALWGHDCLKFMQSCATKSLNANKLWSGAQSACLSPCMCAVVQPFCDRDGCSMR